MQFFYIFFFNVNYSMQDGYIVCATTNISKKKEKQNEKETGSVCFISDFDHGIVNSNPLVCSGYI